MISLAALCLLLSSPSLSPSLSRSLNLGGGWENWSLEVQVPWDLSGNLFHPGGPPKLNSEPKIFNTPLIRAMQASAHTCES